MRPDRYLPYNEWIKFKFISMVTTMTMIALTLMEAAAAAVGTVRGQTKEQNV